MGRLEWKDGPKYCNIMISKIRIQTPVQNILSQYQNIKDMEMQVQYSILNIQYFISICKILSRDGNRESSTLKDVELQAGFTISTTFHNPTWKTRVIPRPSLNKRNGKKSHKNITLLSILPWKPPRNKSMSQATMGAWDEEFRFSGWLLAVQ